MEQRYIKDAINRKKNLETLFYQFLKALQTQQLLFYIAALDEVYYFCRCNEEHESRIQVSMISMHILERPPALTILPHPCSNVYLVCVVSSVVVCSILFVDYTIGHTKLEVEHSFKLRPFYNCVFRRTCF